jgi:C1A family cysteine protease
MKKKKNININKKMIMIYIINPKIKKIPILIIIIIILQIQNLIKCNNTFNEKLNDENIKKNFDDFKLKFKKTYKEKDEIIKMKNFELNLKKINQLNLKYNSKNENDNDNDNNNNNSLKFGINKFADLSEDEFSKFYLGLDIISIKKLSKENYEGNKNEIKVKTINNSSPLSKITPINLISLSTKTRLGKLIKNKNKNKNKNKSKQIIIPESYDLRNKIPFLTPYNQGDCAACWAFSVMHCLEAQYYIKYNKKINLSAQEAIDCIINSNGCYEGNPYDALEYGYYYGYRSYNDYPFLGYNGECKIRRYPSSAFVNDYGYDENVDEEVMKNNLVYLGCYVFVINADFLQFYSGGIIDLDKFECPPGNINHAVSMVGYGTGYNKNYWIVENSWGSDWGENGFFRIIRGKNCCGLKSYLFYSIID